MIQGTITEPFTVEQWAAFCGTPVWVADYVMTKCVLKGWVEIADVDDEGHILLQVVHTKVIHPIRLWKLEWEAE